MFEKNLTFQINFCCGITLVETTTFSYEHFSDPTKHEKVIPEKPKIRVFIEQTLVDRIYALSGHCPPDICAKNVILERTLSQGRVA